MNEEVKAAIAIVKKALRDALSFTECVKEEFLADGGTYRELEEYAPFVQACQEYNAIAEELGLDTVS